LSLDIPVTDWVRRAQEGDVRAFEQLFQQYHRGIYNTIYQMTRNEADAADLTQEVFVRAYRALPRLQTPEAFTSWLYRIAANCSYDLLGRRKKHFADKPIQDEEGDLMPLPAGGLPVNFAIALPGAALRAMPGFPVAATPERGRVADGRGLDGLIRATDRFADR